MLCVSGAETFSQAMKMGSEIYHHLKAVIKAKYGQDGKFSYCCVAYMVFVIEAVAGTCNPEWA